MSKVINFTKELPENYQKIYSINAKATKTGLILNVLAILIHLAIFFPLLFWVDLSNINLENGEFLLILLFTVAGLALYLISHELIHGIVYKLFTKQKLTFGISWSCAFCGVPDIYVTRKTAIWALISPFAFFTILFGIALVLIFSYPTVFIATSFVFAMHVGGCVGDLYVFLLFMFKFKDTRTLMKDTGPEQAFYLPID